MQYTKSDIRYNRKNNEFTCTVTFEDGTVKEIDGRSYLACENAVNEYIHQVLSDLAPVLKAA